MLGSLIVGKGAHRSSASWASRLRRLVPSDHQAAHGWPCRLTSRSTGPATAAVVRPLQAKPSIVLPRPYAVCLHGPVNSTLGGTVVHVLPLAPSRAQRAPAREDGSIFGGLVEAAAPGASRSARVPGCFNRRASPRAPLRLSSLSASAPCQATAQIRFSLGANTPPLGRQLCTDPVSRNQCAGRSASRQGLAFCFSFVGKQAAAPCAFGLPRGTRLAVPPNITFNRTLHGMRPGPRGASVHVAPHGPGHMPLRAG